MINQELNLLFACINKSIKQLRAVKNYYSEDNHNIEFCFYKIMYIYNNLLAKLVYIFDYNLKIYREENSDDDWNFEEMEDYVEFIEHWQIPDNLFLSEKDKKEFQKLLDEFVTAWIELLRLLFD